MAKTILQKLKDMGFDHVTMNLWHGTNLYVNIEGNPPFYYYMGGNVRIHSKGKLDKSTFSKVRTLCRWLNRHRKDVLAELKDGNYYKSEEMGLI